MSFKAAAWAQRVLREKVLEGAFNSTCTVQGILPAVMLGGLSLEVQKECAEVPHRQSDKTFSSRGTLWQEVWRHKKAWPVTHR